MKNSSSYGELEEAKPSIFKKQFSLYLFNLLWEIYSFKTKKDALVEMLKLEEEDEEEETSIWKVLIYDKRGCDLISPILKVGTLRDNGVTLYKLTQTLPQTNKKQSPSHSLFHSLSSFFLYPPSFSILLLSLLSFFLYYPSFSILLLSLSSFFLYYPSFSILLLSLSSFFLYYPSFSILFFLYSPSFSILLLSLFLSFIFFPPIFLLIFSF